MEFMQILNSVEIGHFGQTYDISLNWIGQIIKWLITGIGSVGVGVIVFSLLLKLIVLPLDIYQRVVMRKQNNKMQENQAKMEKLQKQYANDKEKYNQKVMEMYRENGISMFSSCLPMILSMVVFFSAIGGFNAYSKYANIQNYNELVHAYNQKIESYAPETESLSEDMITYVWNEETTDNEGNVTPAHGMITVQAADKAVYYIIETPENLSETSKANLILYVKAARAYEDGYTSVEQEWTSISVDKVTYRADIEKTFALNPQLTATENANDNKDIVREYYIEQACEAARKDYEDNSFDRVGFLWVKNVWNVDAAYEHPLTTHEKMLPEGAKDTFDVNGTKVDFTDIQKFYASPYSLNSFNIVTKNLTAAKESANGYFILIALSIGTILLQQIITMRSQKAQNKYSSVDGQQAATQKTTMIIMTVMFGIFAFMYSAAFSIYMVISSVFSLFSTMLINKIVDVAMNKKEEQAMQARMNRTAPGKKNNADNKGTQPKKSNKENKNK